MHNSRRERQRERTWIQVMAALVILTLQPSGLDFQTTVDSGLCVSPQLRVPDTCREKTFNESFPTV